MGNEDLTSSESINRDPQSPMNVSSWSDLTFVDSNPEFENTPTHALWDDYIPRSSPEEIRFTMISGIYFLKLLGKDDQNRRNLSNLTGQLNAILKVLDYLSNAYPESRLEPLEELCTEFNAQVEGLNVEINEKIWNIPNKILNYQQVLRSDAVKRAIDSFEKRLHDVRQNITMTNVLKTSTHISSARLSTTNTTSFLSAIHQDLDAVLDRIDSTPSHLSQLTAHLPGLRPGDIVVRDEQRSQYTNEFGDLVGFTATARVEHSARVRTLRIFVSGDKHKDSQRWTNEIYSGSLLQSQFSAPVSAFCYTQGLMAILFDSEYVPLSEYLSGLSPLQNFLFKGQTIWDVDKISAYLIEEGIPPGRHEEHRHLNIFVGSLAYVHAASGNMKVMGNLCSWMSHSNYVRELWPKSATYTLSGPLVMHYHFDNPPHRLPLNLQPDVSEYSRVLEYICKALVEFSRGHVIRSTVRLDGIYFNPLCHPICVVCDSKSHFESAHFDQYEQPHLRCTQLKFRRDNESWRSLYGETLANDDVSPGYYITEGMDLPRPEPTSLKRDHIRTLFSNFDSSAVDKEKYSADAPVICLTDAVYFSWWLRPAKWPLPFHFDEDTVVFTTIDKPMYDSDGSLKVPKWTWTTEPPEMKTKMIASGQWVIETEFYCEVFSYSWPKKYWDVVLELINLVNHQMRLLKSSNTKEPRQFIKNFRPCPQDHGEAILLPKTTRTCRALSSEEDSEDLIKNCTLIKAGPLDPKGHIWRTFKPAPPPFKTEVSEIQTARIIESTIWSLKYVKGILSGHLFLCVLTMTFTIICLTVFYFFV